jgi:hypothetical protein
MVASFKVMRMIGLIGICNLFSANFLARLSPSSNALEMLAAAVVNSPDNSRSATRGERL